MPAVWKFPLALGPGPQGVSMPSGSRIVHTHAQAVAGREGPVVWALVEPSNPKVSRTFRVFATGEDIDLPGSYSYIGTVHISWTVWHVFEDVA